MPHWDSRHFVQRLHEHYRRAGENRKGVIVRHFPPKTQ